MKNKRFWAIFGAIIGIIILAGILFAFIGEDLDDERETEIFDSTDYELSYGDIGIREFNLIKNYQQSSLFDDYVIRDNNEYDKNSTIEIYYVIENIIAKDKDGKRLASFSNEINLIGPSGTLDWFSEENSFVFKNFEFDDEINMYKNYITIDTKKLEESGYYLLEVEVKNFDTKKYYREELLFLIR